MVPKIHQLTFLMAAVVAAMTAAGAAAQDPEHTRHVTCARTAQPPVIDGKLDDPAWAEATALEPFVLLHGGEAGRATEARVMADDQALYVGMRCPADSPGALTFGAREHDGAVWEDESVEVFIDPARGFQTYYHFLLNCGNVRRDESGDVTRANPYDVTWNGEWESAVSHDEQAWYAEIRVPFATIGFSGATGAFMGLNLARYDSASGQVTCWSASPGSLHVPQRFGALVIPAAGAQAGLASFDARLTDLEVAEGGVAAGALALTNRTDQTAHIEWTVTVAGIKGIAAQTSGSLDVAPGAPASVPFQHAIEGYGAYLVEGVARLGAAGPIMAVTNRFYRRPIITAFSCGARLPSPAGLALSWAPATFKVMRDTPVPAETCRYIEIAAAANEYEPVQVVLRPQADMAGVTVSAGPLTSRRFTIPESEIEVRLVEYVRVETPTDAFGIAAPYPDPLPPHTEPVTLAAGQNQPFWILVHAPKDAPPGTYKGTISISGAAGPLTEIPLRLRVRGFGLTDETHTRTAYGCGPDMDFLGVNTPDLHSYVYEQYLKCLRDRRIAPYSPMRYAPITYRGAVWTYAAGDLTVSIENLTKNAYATIAYKGVPLGELTNTIALFEKKGVGHEGSGVGWPGVEAVQAREIARDEHRVILEVTGARAASQPAERGYEIQFRLVIPSSGNWFAARMTGLRNTDEVRYRQDGYYYILRSLTDGQAVQAKRCAGWTSPQGNLGAVCQEMSMVKGMSPIFVKNSAWLDPGQEAPAAGPWTIFFVTDQDVQKRGSEILAELRGQSPEQYVPESGTLAITQEGDGPLVFDFAGFDKAAERYLDEWHFNGFNFGRPAESLYGRRRGTPEFEEMYRAVFGPQHEHLIERGWIDKAYSYWIDEPTEQDYPGVIDGMELIQRHMPRLTRLLTEQPEPALFGHVDLWVPVLSAFDEEACKARLDAGDDVWWYVCCGPHAPYPNNFIDHPAVCHRIRFWMMEKYNVSGSLYWHVTYWRGAGESLRNPWTSTMSISPTGNTWGNGDGMLLYPACREPSETPVLDGPVPSLRIEILREGIEDREYFWILRERLAQLKAAALKGIEGRAGKKAAKAIAEAEMALAAPDRLARSLTDYTMNPAAIAQEREALAEAIEGVQDALDRLKRRGIAY